MVDDRLVQGIFTLHDGPPYANGNLHIGHALNKILKDFINRYQILQGKKVNYRYGVWGDWENSYLTMAPQYEAAQIAVFGRMVLNGHIYRGRKPVHWSPSSKTALAEAELEYPEGHVSRSIYAAFKLTSLSDSCPEEMKSFLPDLGVAIWTTTPWTIPGNAAVAVNADLDYAVVELSDPAVDASGADEAPGNDVGENAPPQGEKKSKRGNKRGRGLSAPTCRYLLVGSDLVEDLSMKWGCPLKVHLLVKGSAVENC
ncbi:hypothetical protein CBR_g56609, partial [Chara braunii]